MIMMNNMPKTKIREYSKMHISQLWIDRAEL